MAKAGVKVTWDDKGLNKLMDNLKELGKLRVTVGYQGRTATEQLKPGGPTTSSVARYNEFGTKNIPARPWMRRAVKQSGRAISKVSAMEFGQVAENDADPVAAMAEVGKVMMDAVHDQIDNSRSWAVPNAASTIKQKGPGFPPLDAGHDRLRKGVSWAVRENRTVIKEGK
jgi:HK97 gp10 family phage protein